MALGQWFRKHPTAESLVATLRDEGITDERVLEAIRTVPRDAFVPPELRDRAWENHALPIGRGQTISQPYVVAIMSSALGLTGDEHVLEVGTGSGYQAAILSRLAREVTSLERIPSLAERARKTLQEIGCTNVAVIVADGSGGWPERAPYDAIIVTAGAPEVPPVLLHQLRHDGGRLVIPVGTGGVQRLVRIERHDNRYDETDLGPVAFVPLIGRFGWFDPDAAGDEVRPPIFDEEDLP